MSCLEWWNFTISSSSNASIFVLFQQRESSRLTASLNRLDFIYSFGKLRRLVKVKKVAMLELLIPMATGLLIVCVGKATKLVDSCAHLTALRRDSIGEYSADDAWEFQELEEESQKDI
ncbi:hypothetical protein Sango_1765200 [Sesamum angolense]|uniref:tRNA pseudouridine(55) synthase n=1 Tax=Sesamum angolense TaxID=2727404 RepID=A0AAE2BPI9_9LAMI|nr:hypothetical protein Sango_1765200 [Sesamum angolense]